MRAQVVDRHLGVIGVEREELLLQSLSLLLGQELVQRVEVEGHRDQLAVDAGQHLVLVLAPVGELREVGEDFRRVGPKDVRPVDVHQDAGVVRAVVHVAADVLAAVEHDHPLVLLAGQALGEDGAGKAGPHDHCVKALRHSVFLIGGSVTARRPS
ncbi:MAG: hypothetical protein QM765_02930 [Myxococcales bacterium]